MNNSPVGYSGKSSDFIKDLSVMIRRDPGSSLRAIDFLNGHAARFYQCCREIPASSIIASLDPSVVLELIAIALLSLEKSYDTHGLLYDDLLSEVRQLWEDA